MQSTTILFCGKPGTGKSTTADFLANYLKGIRIGTDSVRESLYPICPELQQFDKLPRDQIWREVISWLNNQEIPETNVLVALTPTRGIDPPHELLNEAQFYQKLSHKQSKETYEELFRRAQHLLEGGTESVILEGTFGKQIGEYSRMHAAQLFGKYGSVHLIETECPPDIAKRNIILRKKGKKDVGSTKATEPWIYDLIAQNYVKPDETEGFNSALTYHTDTQQIEKLYGIFDERILSALMELQRKIKEGKETYEILSSQRIS